MGYARSYLSGSTQRESQRISVWPDICKRKRPPRILHEERAVEVQKERAIFWWGVIAFLVSFWTLVALIAV
jgi:hypothetical protein